MYVFNYIGNNMIEGDKMKYSDELKQKTIEYYLVGYSAQKISEQLGPNEVTIRVWLKENKIPIKVGGSHNTKYSDDVVLKMVELYK